MSQTIECPTCHQLTDIPSYEGDGVYHTCGCPTGDDLARKVPVAHLDGQDAY